MTSEDVRKITFEKIMRGYRPEDVDDFLQQIAIDMDTLTAEKEEVERRKEQVEAKLLVLAQEIKDYRAQEETLKTALLNAQRMGETVVYEAKQKAETMIREAGGKAELLRQQAEQDIDNERFMLEKLKDEVNRFKTTILSLYTQHIESFSALDAPVLRVEEFLKEYYPNASQPDDTPPPAPSSKTAAAAKPQAEEEAAADYSHEPVLPKAADVFEGIQLTSEEN